MSSVNIGGDKHDMAYRYKMPKLLTKVEGRGNGIKTVVPNIVDIARALHIDPAYPTKYFGIELGAQSKFDTKRQVGIVNGKHDAPDLAAELDKFIEIFVLCPNCRLPETRWTLRKGGIHVDCAACGHNGPLATAHKLMKYILNHPPTEGLGSVKGGGGAAAAEPDGKEKKKGKSSKKGSKKDKKKQNGTDGGAEEEDADENGDGAANGAANGSGNNEGSDEADEGGAEDKEELDGAPAVGKGKEKSKKSKGKRLDDDEEEESDDVEWFTDTSKEAAEARKKQEFEEMSKPKIDEITLSALTKDSSRTEAHTLLRVFMARDPAPSVTDVTSELRRLQLARGLDDAQGLKVLFQGLIDSSVPKTAPAQFTKHADILRRYTKERAAALTFLNCLEEYLCLLEPSLLPATAPILQALYETDVLDEDAIKAWYCAPLETSWVHDKDLALKIKRLAKPLVEWLQNAEEDEEGEDEKEA